jgi:hypothetical protein
MDPESSLPFSQEPATLPYSESLESFYTLTHCFFKIYFNIILPSKPTSPKWSVSIRHVFRAECCINFSYHSCVCHMSRPSYPFWFVHPNIDWWRQSSHQNTLRYGDIFIFHFPKRKLIFFKDVPSQNFRILHRISLVLFPLYLSGDRHVGIVYDEVNKFQTGRCHSRIIQTVFHEDEMNWRV